MFSPGHLISLGFYDILIWLCHSQQLLRALKCSNEHWLLPTSLDLQPNTHAMAPPNYPLASEMLPGPHSAKELKLELTRQPSSYTVNAPEGLHRK